MKLYLSNNQIGPQEAQYFAEALKQNTVMKEFLHHFQININNFIQTLTLLYIYRNEIADEGTTYLAKALKLNKVNLFIYILKIFFLDYRRYN
jgi:hypothetical protein